MLMALEAGVRGGVWARLYDKVWALPNLQSAWRKVRRKHGKPGVDHVTVAQFGAQADAELPRLQAALRAHTYQPQLVKRVYIPKPGRRELRPLGIPTVRDRVVQGALRHVLEPILERAFAPQSYGFRPGRDAHQALARVDELLQAGYVHVVDADLKGYFDSIPHDRLLAVLRRYVADGSVLALVAAYLQQGILDGLREWTPTEGTPQGAVLSPLLANLYLNDLDHTMQQAGYQMVRYADDFIILCRTREEAAQALARVQAWVTAAGLTLHPEKTRLVHLDEERAGFDFLGYHHARIKHGRLGRWPREQSLDRFRRRLRELTPRLSGQSLAEQIRRLNPVLRGWGRYFRLSPVATLRVLDGYVRHRLRRMLAARLRRLRSGYGRAHYRWPTAFFTAQGLFCLATAAVPSLSRQSPPG